MHMDTDMHMLNEKSTASLLLNVLDVLGGSISSFLTGSFRGGEQVN